MGEQSVSFSSGSVAPGHDRRSIKNIENVDPTRTKDNIILKDEKIEDVFENLFGDAVREFNDKQKRSDRKIKNYYEQIAEKYTDGLKKKSIGKKSNAMCPEFEYVVGIGDKESNPSFGMNFDRENSIKALEMFYEQFQFKYPDIHVNSFIIHLDEWGAIHAHMRCTPVSDGYKSGMSKRPGMDKALQKCGFKGDKAYREFYASVTHLLSECCILNGIIKKQETGLNRRHIPNELYKFYANDIKEIDATLSAEKRRLKYEADCFKRQNEENKKKQEYYKTILTEEKYNYELLIKSINEKKFELVETDQSIKKAKSELSEAYTELSEVKNRLMIKKNMYTALEEKELQLKEKVEKQETAISEGEKYLENISAEIKNNAADLDDLNVDTEKKKMEIQSLQRKYEMLRAQPPKEKVIEVVNEKNVDYKEIAEKSSDIINDISNWISQEGLDQRLAETAPKLNERLYVFFGNIKELFKRNNPHI